MSRTVLEVKNLAIEFFGRHGWVRAVNDLSFNVYEGEILGIVGESGCGKSVTSMSILGLLPTKTTRIPEGEILFYGDNLLDYDSEKMRNLRGKDIAMVFQDSMTGLNPMMTIGKQLVNAVLAHQNVSRSEAKIIAEEALTNVEIPSPAKRLQEYPHQLSGGMRQRVMIALALINKPKLLIADEPTTALDVTVQAQVLDLMKRLQKANNMSIMLITHDMGVVAEMSDRVMVMYAGEKIEIGKKVEIFESPKHPYTRGLLMSIPSVEEDVDELFSIKGRVPTLQEMPTHCRFFDRCEESFDICKKEHPDYYDLTDTHSVQCFQFSEHERGER